MIDVKIENKDVVTESTGILKRLTGLDAMFQRAFICIASKKGKFVYDRQLGTDISEIDLSAEDAKDRLELVFNEALVNCSNAVAQVLEIGEKIKVKIIIDGQSTEVEVDKA